MSQAAELRANIAAALAILGRDADPFRRVWSGATHAERRVFLLMAAWSQSDAWRAANRTWDEFSQAERAHLKERVKAMRDWLNEKVPA